MTEDNLCKKEIRQNTRAYRTKMIVRSVFETVTVGLFYLFFAKITHLTLPCPVHALTGLQCPGCGITRFFLALSRLDFSAAYQANPFVFIMMPPAVLYFVYRVRKYIICGNTEYSLWEIGVLVLVLFSAVCFTVVRNI